MPWDMASDRTQRFHIRKAKQVVDAALGEIAPQDAEKLWISLVQSKVAAQQTNDEVIDFKLADALAECYKNAGHWGSRRQILSIKADKMDFETKITLAVITARYPSSQLDKWQKLMVYVLQGWIFQMHKEGKVLVIGKRPQ